MYGGLFLWAPGLYNFLAFLFPYRPALSASPKASSLIAYSGNGNLSSSDNRGTLHSGKLKNVEIVIIATTRIKNYSNGI